MSGTTLSSRNTSLGGVAPSGIQQPGGSISSSGRFAPNNLSLAAISQLAHGNAHGHSGVANRGSGMSGVGGSIPGINPSSGVINNLSNVAGLGVSQILANPGARISNSMGNVVGSNIGRNMSSGGLIVPGYANRSALAGSSSNNLNIQGTNRFKSGVLQQAQQMLGMLGNPYPSSGGPLSQNHVQGGNNSFNSMGMLNDTTNENAPFDINDFPQLSRRPSSSGGPQGQLVMRKQGVGVNPVVQQNQEFSIQNEDFPALPGFKSGNSEFGMDSHQKEQLHENVSLLQSHHFPSARSSDLNVGGSYPSHHHQQHIPSYNFVDFPTTNNQDVQLHGSNMFQSSHATYHSQNSGPPSIGLSQLNSPKPVSGVGAYNQLVQHYQHHQNRPQFHTQQISTVGQSHREQTQRSTQANPESFGMLGLLAVIRMTDQDLATLALGIDLTTLGLNLNSPDTLYKTFGSPWLEGPVRGESEYSVPACYYSEQLPPLHMPKDEAQLFAAHELCMRGWFYHKELRMWLTRVANMEPLVKTNTYERGHYHCFSPAKWETIRKDNFVVHYEMVEKKPVLHQPQH